MNKHVIIRNIERAESSIIDRLGAAGAATVHEAIGRGDTLARTSSRSKPTRKSQGRRSLCSVTPATTS